MTLVTKLTNIKMCVNQLRPTDIDIYAQELGMQGIGDCSTCTPDCYNKFCRLYIPINITLFTYEEIPDKSI